MKIISYIFLIILICSSCKVHLKNYYSGIIVDELGVPAESVYIKESDIIENHANKTSTDVNGYFKMKRRENFLSNLILSKKGYISDTIRIVWHQHGETTDYSPIITKDSVNIVLRGTINNELDFKEEIIERPIFNTIINSRYSLKNLEGTWLKTGFKELNGFKFDENGLYIFGISGNRNIRYNINMDTIRLFRDNYHLTKKGIIKSIENNVLKIQWNKDYTVEYKKFN